MQGTQVACHRVLMLTDRVLWEGTVQLDIRHLAVLPEKVEVPTATAPGQYTPPLRQAYSDTTNECKPLLGYCGHDNDGHVVIQAYNWPR